MPIDAAKLDEANRVFRAIFLRELLGQAPRPLDMIATSIPVKGKSLKPKFLSRSSGVHEWVDERIMKRLRAHDFEIVVKKWANGLVVDGEDLEDDQENLSLYSDQIGDMADDFSQHKYERAVDFLQNGFDATLGTAYDGQFFFDSDHQDSPDGPTQRNVRTAALSETAFYQCVEDMGKIKKPNGKHARVQPTHVMIPLGLKSTADTLFGQRERTGGGSNPLFGAVEVIVEPLLDYSSTAWFAFDFSKRLKPIAIADRRGVTFRAKTQPNSDNVFDRDEYEYGADARYGVGYYFWQTSWASDGTT